ncbi:serine/threonine protein kinase [Actinomycetospora succinea]|uniref:non-specific serine/threonine protein kinase n=1 Tax=Actinomycetospora succinea TaxID=663603 RepID=A0A4R6UZY4_9PSEU|nr:serine/threonine-protein kinase [Actinomycetospora succinea]TDQ51719.1 serine/threonine protein kinase [Actinomycetospora succinea]
MQHQPRTSRMHGPVAAPSTLHPSTIQGAAPAPVDTSVVGTVLGGRYRIGECIGAGAMGVVFTAWDRRLRRTVAIKQLAARGYRDATEERVARARAMREGRIAARVVHPRAIAVFDVVVDTAGPWLVMEYLPSRSLSAVLAEQGPLAPSEAAWIGAQVAEALGAVHEAGIVHGDIKPGNVLITDEGVAKITDFGVSRAVWDTTSTGGGMVAGTPGYFAPEVARGGDPSPASDVFSLGATLYAAVENQLVCGHHDNTLAVLHAMAEGRLRPAERAGVLGRPLAAMLRLDPSHRPDTAAVERALRTRAGSTPFIPAPVSEPAAVDVPAPRPTGTADLPLGPLVAGEEPAPVGDGIDPEADVPAADPDRISGPSAAVAASALARPGAAAAPTRTPGTTSDRRRPSRRPSPRRIAAVVAASAVVLGAGIGVALAATAGGGTVAAPAPSTTVPTTAAPASDPFDEVLPTPSVAAPVSPVDPAGDPDPATVVVDYYAALPGDIDRAWGTLSERAQDESGGYEGYQRFWSGIREVRTSNVSVRGDTVTADIEFTTASGRTSRETYRFEVDKDDDGQVRIQRAGRGSDSM